MGRRESRRCRLVHSPGYVFNIQIDPGANDCLYFLETKVTYNNRVYYHYYAFIEEIRVMMRYLLPTYIFYSCSISFFNGYDITSNMLDRSASDDRLSTDYRTVYSQTFKSNRRKTGHFLEVRWMPILGPHMDILNRTFPGRPLDIHLWTTNGHSRLDVQWTSRIDPWTSCT